MKMYEMYSSNWIVFQPDVIIDAAQGCLWKVELNLSAFPNMISDRYINQFNSSLVFLSRQ